jgi:predicted amidophosphoribosyltransferase
MTVSGIREPWWLLQRVAPALLPEQCPGCGRLRSGPCPLCQAALAAAPPGDGPTGVVALRRYDGLVRDLITGMKYRRQPLVAAWFAEIADEVRSSLGYLDVVTWAPTSARRRRQRGFDQAELIARCVARRWRLPARRLLVRQPGHHQTGRSRSDRLGGPEFRAGAVLPGAAVLVVDDVVTTGATLYAAVSALREAGTTTVVAMAMAATPGAQPLRSMGRSELDRPGR